MLGVQESWLKSKSIGELVPLLIYLEVGWAWGVGVMSSHPLHLNTCSSQRVGPRTKGEGELVLSLVSCSTR